jgi:hypothetical protein
MTSRKERGRVAEQTMVGQPVMVYSEVSDDLRWHQLHHRHQRRGLARLLTVAHRGYKTLLSRMLHHRYLRRVIGFLCRFDSDAYTVLIGLSIPFSLMFSFVLAVYRMITTMSSFMLISIIPLCISLAIKVILMPWYTDKTIMEDHITTHRVRDHRLQEHTIIVSTMDSEHTSEHLRITEAELDTNEYVYHVKHDLRPLTIWSTIPLSKNQIVILSERDFLMVQQRVESSDTRYDLHDYHQVSDDHTDARLPLYYQCVDLLHDDRRLIEQIGQPALADQLGVIANHMSEAKNHGLSISSDITMRELRDILAQLDDMHDQLLVLNEDYASIRNDKMTISRINQQVHMMAKESVSE